MKSNVERVCRDLAGVGDSLARLGGTILKEVEGGFFTAGRYKPGERLLDALEFLMRLQSALYATLSVLNRYYGLEKIKPGLNGSVEGARAFEKWLAAWVNLDSKGKIVKLARALQIIGSGVKETAGRLPDFDPGEAARYITSMMNLNRGMIEAASTLVGEYTGRHVSALRVMAGERL